MDHTALCWKIEIYNIIHSFERWKISIFTIQGKIVELSEFEDNETFMTYLKIPFSLFDKKRRTFL